MPAATEQHITSIDCLREFWPHAGRRGKTVTVYRATCTCGWKDGNTRTDLREANAWARLHKETPSAYPGE